LPHRAFVAAAAWIALSGCNASDEGTQPAPSVSSFTQGDFEGLPLPPRSEPVGGRTEERGVVARSYAARDTTPEAVMDFYAQELESAAVLEPPDELGIGTFRGRWLVGNGELTVSATRESSLDAIERFGDEAGVVTQFSLSLAPSSDE
jgi:hypothetical protein